MATEIRKGERAVAVSKDAPPPVRPSRTVSYWLYLVPSGVLFTVVIGAPFVASVVLGFTRWQGIGAPTWIGLENYQRLFQDERFWQSFEHNLVLILAMAVIPTFLGLVLASVLFDFVGKRYGARTASGLRAAFYLPQVLPVAVAGVVWTWILKPTGGALNAVLEAIGLPGQDWLGDESLALPSVGGILVWLQIGYPVVIFMSGLQRVDPSLYEAAEIDGAGWWRRFRHITVPQIRPEIYVVLLTCTIAALKVFGPIYVLTRGGPGGATNVPSYFSYQNFFQKTQVGYGSAIATVLTLVIVAVTFLFLRAQRRGEETS
ncbi:multiple sugar transport system permease protein/raffinose/stachyose/melibiose transport system permease protein [Actinocorallia herbida]|uniref:Multiple sugar transport system permease protein/raffinose/stachyose/melibiose transport system permease protein n=1 Tax=Actinocorallia herbida TaxID=58109 RepID=A0A3N1CWM7_9ACTN|nr:sugar ABC transporter permease [Actinocorallia herbida]ROO85691.1 multiple sugar transport system permease protein/raffinose/stachyose/melibiose transport system permease protein [Actinocorallia herbida]